jgi:hypothetical protein
MACINSYYNSNINEKIKKEKYRFQQKKSLIERKNLEKKIMQSKIGYVESI